ncbi:DUF4348 domain-containing protein [Flagellimonas pacifica]|uniref:DUF4348 domain-containing protein n=1 Tax=Flagellimonas pacifica TaxID=1247520 RepID=A0A285MCD1_9FLAO|nr:DUF4348 domain-containing protein [Allomuricauda parva]SNY94789.1 protein of unknown function [Allomuricauda parva]
MRRIKLTVFVLMMLGVFSCKQEPRDKEISSDTIESIVSGSEPEPVSDKHKEENVAKVIEMDKNCDQTFDDFFERFAKDSVFQKNRVKYPMKDSYIESLDPTVIKVDSITYKKYIYLDFTRDKEAMKNKYGKYTVETKIIKDSLIHYFWFGYDNGIHVTYKFSLINGCWYLVEILDEST